MDTDIVKNEIQLAEDECCIVFDLGCYFPYKNQESLTFDFSLGEETFDDYKKNHRYKNNNYQTISKKTGSKVSKLGYPYVMKLNEQGLMMICLKVGIKDKYMTLIFPLETKMTKEKPCCGLSLRYFFDRNEFYFESNDKADDGGWEIHRWCNYIPKNAMGNEVLLSSPRKVSDSHTCIFNEVITPYASSLTELCLLF